MTDFLGYALEENSDASSDLLAARLLLNDIVSAVRNDIGSDLSNAQIVTREFNDRINQSVRDDLRAAGNISEDLGEAAVMDAVNSMSDLLTEMALLPVDVDKIQTVFTGTVVPTIDEPDDGPGKPPGQTTCPQKVLALRKCTGDDAGVNYLLNECIIPEYWDSVCKQQAYDYIAKCMGACASTEGPVPPGYDKKPPGSAEPEPEEPIPCPICSQISCNCPPPNINVILPSPETPDPDDDEKPEFKYWVWSNVQAQACTITVSLGEPNPPLGLWTQIGGPYSNYGSAYAEINNNKDKYCAANFADIDLDALINRIKSFVPPAELTGLCEFVKQVEDWAKIPGIGKNVTWAQAAGFRYANNQPVTPKLWEEINLFGFPIGSWAAAIVRQLLDYSDQTEEILTLGTSFGFQKAMVNRKWAQIGNMIIPGLYREEIYKGDALLNVVQGDYIQMTAAEADRAYLTNEISLPEWKCAQQIEARNVTQAERNMQSMRSKMTPYELVQAFRREIIDDPEFLKRFRSLGWLEPGIAQEYLELTKFVPPPTDLIRMMVREAADESIPFWPESDASFEGSEKYSGVFKGKIVDWAKDQGMDKEVFKLLWRSHWDLPAAGQLFEMYQRLRHLPPDDPAYISWDEVEQTLRQNDMLPAFIPRFQAIAFNPLTRRDAIRGFQSGDLDNDQFTVAMQQVGYDETNTELLVKINQTRKRLSARNQKSTRMYIRGGINSATLVSELEDVGYTPAESDNAKDWALSQIESNARVLCTRALRKQFLSGTIKEAEIITKLLDNGLDQEQSEVLAKAWICEKQSTPKEISAASLCRLADENLITRQVYVDRLMNLGYEQDDAVLLADSCGLRSIRRQAKEDAASDAKAKRLAAQKTKMNRGKVRSQLARDKKLAGATIRLVKSSKGKLDIDTAGDWVASALLNLRGSRYSLDEVVMAIDKASFVKTSLQNDYVRNVEQILEEIASIFDDPDTVEPSGSPGGGNGNGTSVSPI